MTKTCLFLPVIDIMVIRNAPQMAATKKSLNDDFKRKVWL
jgi:hypothetical protein